MKLSLQTYRPFDFARAGHEKLCEAWNHKGTLLKICLVAYRSLFLLLASLADLLFIPAARVYQSIKKNPPLNTDFEIVPSTTELEQAISNPYPEGLQEVDCERFLKESVERALASLPTERASYYRELIGLGGISEDGEPGEIEIYRWMAECALVQALLCRLYGNERLPPFLPPSEELSPLIRSLSREQISQFVLKAWMPETNWSLSPLLKRRLNQLHGIAQEFSMSPPFNGVLRRVFPVQ